MVMFILYYLYSNIMEMISEAYGHKHIDTTIKYLNLVDDQLMEASDQYYAKHSALYDVEKLL